MSRKIYSNVSELISDLITADRENYPDGYVNSENFDGSFFEGVEDQTNYFWKELLDYLKSQSPTLQSDFNDSTGHSPSVFSYINGKSDLNDTFWNKIINQIKDHIDLSTESGVEDGNLNYFWNESLNKLIAGYIKSMPDSSEDGLIPIGDGKYVSIADIKNADAGYDFKEKWVRPLKNIDEQIYGDVRGEDKIESVLNNSDELQFTRTKTGNDDNKWLRLLMPKYLRKVEVEDLNRNFWVISQVLTALCSYLFDTDYLENFYKGVLKELVGLWENTLYLWGAAAMTAQEKDKFTDIHVEVVPIPNDEFLSYRKFDNFDNNTDIISGTASEQFAALLRRIRYIIQSYSTSHVIIIPEVRSRNYKHNFYSRVDYPGILVYNRNTGLGFWSNFRIVDSSLNSKTFTIDLEKDYKNEATHEYTDKITGLKEKNEITYQYYYPFQNTGADTNNAYYGAIRTILEDIAVDYLPETEEIQVSNIHFCLYDPFSAIAKQENTYKISTIATDNSVFSFTNQTYPTEISLQITDESTVAPSSGEHTLDITKGYYLGEMVSCCSKIITNEDWVIESQTFWGQPTFTATPQEIVAILGESS